MGMLADDCIIGHAEEHLAFRLSGTTVSGARSFTQTCRTEALGPVLYVKSQSVPCAPPGAKADSQDLLRSSRLRNGPSLTHGYFKAFLANGWLHSLYRGNFVKLLTPKTGR